MACNRSLGEISSIFPTYLLTDPPSSNLPISFLLSVSPPFLPSSLFMIPSDYQRTVRQIRRTSCYWYSNHWGWFRWSCCWSCSLGTQTYLRIHDIQVSIQAKVRWAFENVRRKGEELLRGLVLREEENRAWTFNSFEFFKTNPPKDILPIFKLNSLSFRSSILKTLQTFQGDSRRIWLITLHPCPTSPFYQLRHASYRSNHQLRWKDSLHVRW